MSPADVVIIGAGMAGLAAARMLEAAGLHCLILEKSRGLGGRAATRRIGGQPVDFGAQFFTVRSPEFAERVRDWEARGLCRVWCQGFTKWQENEAKGAPGDGHARYCAPNGFTAIAKHEAQGLDIRRETRVVEISHGEGGFLVQADNGQFHARRLLLTAPAPQSLQLARKIASREAVKEFSEIEYSPCFSLIARLPGYCPAWRGIQCEHPVLEWLAADDTRREAASELFVLHANPAFSRSHFDSDLQEVARRMLDAAQQITGANFSAAEVEHFHRWRFARVENPLPLPRFRVLDEGGRVLFAGDAFREPKLESAWLSGREAAAQLLKS